MSSSTFFSATHTPAQAKTSPHKQLTAEAAYRTHARASKAPHMQLRPRMRVGALRASSYVCINLFVPCVL